MLHSTTPALKVDATAVLFPVAVARGLRPLAPAEFPGPFAGSFARREFGTLFDMLFLVGLLLHHGLVQNSPAVALSGGLSGDAMYPAPDTDERWRNCPQ